MKKRVSVEMGSNFGWEQYVGDHEAIISIDTFEASTPGNQIMEEFVFSVENVVNTYK